MHPPEETRTTRALPLLEELPGMTDVVWATVTRLASERAQMSVLFTAVERSAGTSVLASATAIGLVRHQRVRVCLVETNLRRPALAGYLGLETAGLADVLDGRAELEDCLQELPGCPGLFVLPAGTPRAPESGEFTSDRLRSIMAALEQRCSYLVLDAAPVLEHMDTRQLLGHADAAMLVLRARTTRQSDARRALDILAESGTPVLGSIFNASRTRGLFGRIGSPRRWLAGSEHAERGGTPVATGGTRVELPAQIEETSEAAHRREIDLLERRIAKLTRLLAMTEADLRRITETSDADPGIPSIYRRVQGLSWEDKAHALKRSLMDEILQANLELKRAMDRHR